MLAAACGGMDGLSAEEALAEPNNVYFEARDGETRLGFVAFRPFWGDVAEVHTCLLTLGSRSVFALGEAIRQMFSRGYRRILAIFPKSNRGAERVTSALCFQDIQSGVSDEWHRRFLDAV